METATIWHEQAQQDYAQGEAELNSALARLDDAWNDLEILTVIFDDHRAKLSPAVIQGLYHLANHPDPISPSILQGAILLALQPIAEALVEYIVEEGLPNPRHPSPAVCPDTHGVTITHDQSTGGWVATGTFEGRPFKGYGAEPGEAFNNAITDAQEGARRAQIA